MSSPDTFEAALRESMPLVDSFDRPVTYVGMDQAALGFSQLTWNKRSL